MFVTLVRLGMAVMLAVAAGCGDDGAPKPGYAEPCASPAAPVLGCSAGTALGSPLPFSADQACDRLVSCGLLAADALDNDGNHKLDHRWCVLRLIVPAADPCDSARRFSSDEVDSAVDCIRTTPCAALGLSYQQKTSENDAELDRYQCNDQSSKRTATICDHGLLSY